MKSNESAGVHWRTWSKSELGMRLKWMMWQCTIAMIVAFPAVSVSLSSTSVAQIHGGGPESAQTGTRSAVADSRVGQFETVRYANQFPCPSSPGCKGNSDFGAQIMATYTDCPSTGCRIRVPSNRSCWSYTTPLVFDNQGKNVILEGDGTTQTCLFFNATSGSAITIDTGGSVSGGESVFRNLILLGRCADSSCSGVIANGVVIGPTNGTGTLSFEDFQVGLQVGVPNTACPGRCGFLNGFLLGSAVVNLGLSFYNTSILSSHFAINANNQNYENLHWFGGFCAQNDYCFTGPSAGDYYFHSVSFDDNEEGAIRTTANAGISAITVTLKTRAVGPRATTSRLVATA